jgi:hypothetical protein
VLQRSDPVSNPAPAADSRWAVQIYRYPPDVQHSSTSAQQHIGTESQKGARKFIAPLQPLSSAGYR